MLRVAATLLLLAVASDSISQNLVTNPGFEKYYRCPGSFSASSTGEFAPGWSSPSTGTPDLFHTCSTGDAGVPTNWAGYSKAYSGSGYAGIYAFMFGSAKEYREYMQTKLLEPMADGAQYLVEFYYKLSSNSRYGIDRIGFLISDSLYLMAGDGVYPHVATYERINQTIYSSASGLWTRFHFVYEAKGGEQYLTIGNFSNSHKTRNQYIQNSQATEPMLARAAYFFIDDVKVVKVKESPNVPVLTGYPEITTNKDYVLKNIQFKYDDFTLLETSYPELKKLVEIMQYHKTWRVVVSGHTDDVGSEKYNLELSINRATSVSDYLVSNGIDPARITTQGFGKQSPLVQGTDETARSTNRRVELRFLN